MDVTTATSTGSVDTSILGQDCFEKPKKIALGQNFRVLISSMRSMEGNKRICKRKRATGNTTRIFELLEHNLTRELVNRNARHLYTTCIFKHPTKDVRSTKDVLQPGGYSTARRLLFLTLYSMKKIITICGVTLLGHDHGHIACEDIFFIGPLPNEQKKKHTRKKN